MGKVWLHDWPDAIRDYGVNVEFWPGWELASRWSGGLEAVLGVGIHHDAASIGASTLNRLRYAYNTAATRPIGNAALKKRGGIVIGAAGATNTQGISETGFWTSKGFIPKSQGNLYMISLEAENNGVGEVWDDKQLEDYEAVMAATCDCYALDPTTDIFSHHRYTSRKVDPRGPTPARPSWGGPLGALNQWDDISVGRSVLQRQLSHKDQNAGVDPIMYIVKPGKEIKHLTDVHFACYESGIVRHAQGPDTHGVTDIRECRGVAHFNGYVRAANHMSGANLTTIK